MKRKRLLAMLLAVMMIVTALPVGIFAEEEQAELPGAGFFSAPEYTAEYYVGTDLPFTGRNQDADGKAYEVYYYLKRRDDVVEDVTVLNFDGEADPFVTVELVDGQYAKLTLKEGFEPDMGFDIMMTNSLGGEWIDSFSIVDQREAGGGNTDSSITTGYYGSKSGDANTSLGKGEGVIEGEVGKTVTAYLVWDPDTCGTLQDVLVSFRPSKTGMLFEEQEMSTVTDRLANYGVTLLLNETYGYIQVQAVISESLNVGLTPVLQNAEQKEYWLSIDPKSGSAGDDDDDESGNEDPSDIFTDGPGLYWRNFSRVSNGEPVFSSRKAETSMWDEVGQDITAVFYFWDGETAVEIAPDQLVFPEDLKWEVSKDYTDAVYMEFDTAMEAKITYTKGDVTYEFPLTVEVPGNDDDDDDGNAGGEIGVSTIAYFNKPERLKDNWNKQEWLTGLSGEAKSVYLMWDPELFELDEKADFKIYLEKNEDEGVELPAAVWNDDVDALLADYGVNLTLDTDKALVQVDAEFAKVSGTLDFAAFVTDKKGLEYEVQISIDLVMPTVKTEHYAPALKWRPVVKVDGVYTELTGEPLRSCAEIVAKEDLVMALYEVDEDGNATPVSSEHELLKTAGRFGLAGVRNSEDHWVQVVSEGTTVGSVHIASFYGSKLMPRYKDSADIDEDAFNAVELLYALNIMRGDARGNFNPNGRVTRAELAKIICVIWNYGEDDGAENWRDEPCFSDIASNEWYAGYVNYCAVNKLVQGVDGKFSPNESVTVVKAAKTILLALGYSAEVRGYDDPENGSASILADAQTIGLLDGVACALNGDISRQWLAKMLENMLLKAYTYQQVSNKYYYVPAGVKYFDLTNESIEYQTVYRAIPLDAVPPFAAFYTDSSRTFDSFADKKLFFDPANPKSYYLLVEDGWTITDIVMDPDFDMNFFQWEPVELDDGSTVVEVNFRNDFPAGAWYLIGVTAENDKGETTTYYTNFTIQTAGTGKLIWRQVLSDDGEFYVKPGDHSEITIQAGYDYRMAFYLLSDDSEIPIKTDDLAFPDIVNVYNIKKYPYFCELELEEYGSGFVVCEMNGSLYQMPIECTLPALSFYSKPERGEAYYLEDMLMGYYGQTKTAYLVWDPEDVGEVEKVTVYFKMSNADAELDGVELEDAEDVLAEHDIVLTPYLDKGYIQVDAGVGIDKNLELTLHYTDGDSDSAWLNIDNSLTVIINEWRRNKDNPVVEYNGVEYTFGIGRIEDSGKFDMFSAGQGFGSTTSNKEDILKETIYLGAMTDYDTNKQAIAPAWIYQYISDVSFTIAEHINADDLTDQAESNIYIDRVYKTEMAEMEMHTADIYSVTGGFAEALLQVRFTVTFPGEHPVDCLVENVVHFAYNLNLYPDLSDIDTAEELNELFSSEDVFFEWIKEQDEANDTTMYADYYNNFALNWESSFELNLPAVTYDDIITVSLDNVEFDIRGSKTKDGTRTTMPGMHLIDNNHFFLGDIDFVAVSGKTQSYRGETFTCGVLSGGDGARNRDNEAYTVYGCTFTGFDYGVRNTHNGYTCAGSRNIFTDCKVGYLIDCAEKNGGNGNSETTNSRFVNCGTAIRIKGLRSGMPPYDYRVHNCDFIGNDMDIDVSQEGRFYFIKNYYGDVQNKHADVVDDAGDVHKRPPRVRGRGYAEVVVNPRWRDPVTLDGSNHKENHLIVDTKHGLVNYMFNDDARFYSFDTGILNTDLSSQDNGIDLTMTDDRENTIGTWSVEGGSAQAQLLSLFTEEPVADTFCPALDIETKNDGTVTVAVNDSDLFSQRKVTLTIPCNFVVAAVTLNGQTVASVTANGQVTFNVTAGGTYVISEALNEETLDNSFVPGGAAEGAEGESTPEAEVQIGWFDFNAQQEAKPSSFVTLSAQKQEETKKVNPDEDLKVEVDKQDEWVGEETEIVETITVQAIYQAPVADDHNEEIRITVLLVLYDSNGRMIAMKEQAAQQNEGTKVITVECDSSLISTDAVTVKAFVIAADGSMSPLAPVPFSQTLKIPAN